MKMIKAKSKPVPQRAGLFSSLYDSLKSHDEFGQGIAINYQGNETFQTLPGALLSLVSKVMLVIYVFYKGKSLVLDQAWSLES